MCVRRKHFGSFSVCLTVRGNFSAMSLVSVDFPHLFGSFTENVSAAFLQVIRNFSVGFLDQQQVIRNFSEAYLKAYVSTGTPSGCPFPRTAPPLRDGDVPLPGPSVLTVTSGVLSPSGSVVVAPPLFPPLFFLVCVPEGHYFRTNHQGKATECS